MLKWLFRQRLDAFDRAHGYDSAYVREILDADLEAAIGLSRVTGLTKYRKGVATDAWYAAKLVGTLAEDCGPCTQLVVTMAEHDGVPQAVIRAILNGDRHAMTADVSLAFQFAQAVLRHDPEADVLRERVVATWGEKGLISLGFALTMARFFPTLKYALGHGKACQRVKVGNAEVTIHGHPQMV